jgi:hypothetical protein
LIGDEPSRSKSISRAERRPMHWLILTASALLFAPVVHAGPAGLAGTAEPDYKPMPWHLVDLWWDLGRKSPFESYSVDVNIDTDVPPEVRTSMGR